MNRFSQRLISKTINHFKQKYDVELSVEQADCYLSSFAVVFRSFVPAVEDGGQTNSECLRSTGDSNTRRTFQNEI